MLNEYNIQDGETIFDVAIATYGSLEQVYKLIQENPVIENINSPLDLVSHPGLSLLYDESFVSPETQEERKVPEVVQPQEQYETSEGQSIFDLALNMYGDLESVYSIIKENTSVISYINANIPAGSKLVYKKGNSDNYTLKDYLDQNNIIINTSYPVLNTGSGFSFGFKYESFY